MEVARDDRQLRAVPLERGDDLGPVTNAADEAIETMNDDSIDLPRGDAFEKALQRRPICGCPTPPDVVEALPQGDPALKRVRTDARKADIPLGLAGVKSESVARATDWRV
jgi:hypothetical protein